MGSALRTRLIPALVLLLIVGAIWWARRGSPPKYSVAYVNDRSAIVWSTTAQVRERIAELRYGQRVSVLERTGDETEVRSDDGVQGWVDTQLLMSPELWQQASDLLARARSLPVQASGHTRAVSNIHTEASRTAARVFQFGRNVPVVVLERKVNAVPVAAAPASATPTAQEGAPEGDAGGVGSDQPKQEDWLLVLHVAPLSGGAADAAANAPSQPATSPIATTTAITTTSTTATTTSTATTTAIAATTSSAGPQNGASAAPVAGADIPIAGWVLARFVELDPPAPVADYASSAAVRVVAWMVLNHAQDGGRPQYLVAGTHGGEGQPCDFTSLRVYTWGGARGRYETAYVESDLCGQFPIRTSETADGAEFRFTELDEGGAERVYRMKQTIVRRVREGQPKAGSKR